MRLKLTAPRGKRLGDPTAPEHRAPRGYYQYRIDGVEGIVWLPAHWLPDGAPAPPTLDVDWPGLEGYRVGNP